MIPSRLATITDLPPEMISQIVAGLTDDIPSLRAGSLIAPYPKPIFQKPLFECVYLHDKPNHIVTCFEECAIASPDLLSFIRSFSIEIISHYESKLLSDVLSHKRIRSLRIKVTSNLSDDTLASLSSSISQNTALRELRLENANPIAFSHLNECRSLKHLSLCNVRFQTTTDATQIDETQVDEMPLMKAGEQPIQLDTLQLGDSRTTLWIDPVARWLLRPQCPFDIRNVKTLNMPLKEGWELMKRCAQVVETMRIEIYPDYDTDLPFVADFSIFPKLHTLYIYMIFIDDPNGDAIEDMFENFEQGNPLRTIHLVINIEHGLEAAWHVEWVLTIFDSEDIFGGAQVVITFAGCTSWVQNLLTNYFDGEGLSDIEHIQIRYDPAIPNVDVDFLEFVKFPEKVE